MENANGFFFFDEILDQGGTVQHSPYTADVLQLWPVLNYGPGMGQRDPFAICQVEERLYDLVSLPIATFTLTL